MSASPLRFKSHMGYFTVLYVTYEPVLFRENGIFEAMNLQARGTHWSQVFEFVDCVQHISLHTTSEATNYPI